MYSTAFDSSVGSGEAAASGFDEDFDEDFDTEDDDFE